MRGECFLCKGTIMVNECASDWVTRSKMFEVFSSKKKQKIPD